MRRRVTKENFLRRMTLRQNNTLSVYHLRSALEDDTAADADWSFFDLYATSRFSLISSSESHLEYE